MKLRHAAATLFIVVSLLAFGAGVSAGGKEAASAKYRRSEPASAGQTAEGFLHSIYDRYTGPQDKAGPIDSGSTRELRHYFERSLATIIHKDFIGAKKADDVPTLDADPFIDAQDWDIKSFDIHVTPVDANHATGLIKFDNAGTAKVCCRCNWFVLPVRGRSTTSITAAAKVRCAVCSKQEVQQTRPPCDSKKAIQSEIRPVPK